MTWPFNNTTIRIRPTLPSITEQEYKQSGIRAQELLDNVYYLNESEQRELKDILFLRLAYEQQLEHADKDV